MGELVAVLQSSPDQPSLILPHLHSLTALAQCWAEMPDARVESDEAKSSHSETMYVKACGNMDRILAICDGSAGSEASKEAILQARLLRLEALTVAGRLHVRFNQFERAETFLRSALDLGWSGSGATKDGLRAKLCLSQANFDLARILVQFAAAIPIEEELDPSAEEAQEENEHPEPPPAFSAIGLVDPTVVEENGNDRPIVTQPRVKNEAIWRLLDESEGLLLRCLHLVDTCLGDHPYVIYVLVKLIDVFSRRADIQGKLSSLTLARCECLLDRAVNAAVRHSTSMELGMGEPLRHLAVLHARLGKTGIGAMVLRLAQTHSQELLGREYEDPADAEKQTALLEAMADFPTAGGAPYQRRAMRLFMGFRVSSPR